MTAFCKIFKECFWKIKLLGLDMDIYWHILLIKNVLFAICTTLTLFLWNTFYYALHHIRSIRHKHQYLMNLWRTLNQILSKHVSLLKDQWVCLLQPLVEIIMRLLFLSVYLSLCCFLSDSHLLINTHTHTPYSFCSSGDIGRPISAASIVGPVWKTGPAQLTIYQRILHELYSSLHSAR